MEGGLPQQEATTTTFPFTLAFHALHSFHIETASNRWSTWSRLDLTGTSITSILSNYNPLSPLPSNVCALHTISACVPIGDIRLQTTCRCNTIRYVLFIINPQRPLLSRSPFSQVTCRTLTAPCWFTWNIQPPGCPLYNTYIRVVQHVS